MKVCPRCPPEKGLQPFSAFYRRTRSSDGYGLWCKACCRAYHTPYMRVYRKAKPEKGQQYRVRHAPEIQAYNQGYRKRRRQERYQYNLDWDAKNPGRIQFLQQRWNQTYPEKVVAKSRRWQKKYPQKVRTIKAARYARQKGAPVVEQVDLLVLAERDNYRCHLCGRKVARSQLSRDHLIPVGPDSPHTYQNIALAHKTCNASRGRDRLPAQLRLFGLPDGGVA